MSSDRMRSLIDDLLTFSRLSSIEKTFINTDLNKILQDVLADFDLLIQEKKASLQIERLPVIQAVPLQMNQLFYNLVANALKFTAQNRDPVITITCRSLSEDEIRKFVKLDGLPTYYEISIKDNGIGFPQEFADQIFVIFQRLNDKDCFSRYRYWSGYVPQNCKKSSWRNLC